MRSLAKEFYKEDLKVPLVLFWYPFSINSENGKWNISLKKSSGFDEITSKLMNISAAALAKPLNLIINRAFKSGQFPKTLQLSKISLIYKKKGKKNTWKWKIDESDP